MISVFRKARIHLLAPARGGVWAGVFGLCLTVGAVAAEPLDAVHALPVPSSLPDAGASVFRVSGAFVLVVALFLGGVWLFRNWQRLTMQRNGAAKLNLIEVKSLGQRQAIYVVGYQQQRMLLASSPAGVALISHLPPAEESEKTATVTNLSFAEALQHVLSRRP